ncbi:acyl-homoserine-lactone synthase [Sinorhizobium meliloti]|nr:acyl-homoserine-lactone synthase [Sinorhizobium meliloti]WKL40514.1 acyl-homoserine-lactone synthase [Sinorhizobium meliloti]
MLKILTRADYADQSYEEMLRGRAKTFGERLNWSVAIRDGKEFDSYDQDADPIYLTALDERGARCRIFEALAHNGSNHA